MEHKAKVVRISHISDEMLAVTIACCNEDSRGLSASTHTMASAHERTAEELAAWIAEKCDEVGKKHEAMLRVKEHVERLSGIDMKL